MNELFALEVGRNALMMTVMLAAPMMVAALVVGLLVSVFQALTQINEQTLTFVPKILAVFAALLVAGPWLIQSLVSYTTGPLHDAAVDGALGRPASMPTAVPSLQPSRPVPGDRLADRRLRDLLRAGGHARARGAHLQPAARLGPMPMPGRIGIGLFATLVLFPIGGPYEAPANVGPLEVGAELMVGLLAGFAITLIFGSIQFMGSLIGITSGFSFAQTINPMFDHGSGGGGVVETFITSFALLVFVEINGHHLFLIGLKQLFDVVPVGEVTHLPGSLERCMHCPPRCSAGLKLALPVMAALLLADLAARAARPRRARSSTCSRWRCRSR